MGFERRRMLQLVGHDHRYTDLLRRAECQVFVDRAGPRARSRAHWLLRCLLADVNLYDHVSLRQRPYSNAGGKRWCVAILSARSEFAPSFLYGVQRSVNRKVQGSNPCPGANPHTGANLPIQSWSPPVTTGCSL